MPGVRDKIIICGERAAAEIRIATELSKEVKDWRAAPKEFKEAYGRCLEVFVLDMQELNAKFNNYLESI